MRVEYYLAVLKLLPVEVDVAEVENRGDDLEDDLLLLGGEPQHLKKVMKMRK